MSEYSVNPWQQNAVTLAILGKLGEELDELQACVCRCINQGVGEVEPVTKKPNIEWLKEEMADVLAGLWLVAERFNLLEETGEPYQEDFKPEILERVNKKMAHLRSWYEMIRDAKTS